jgi:hypothetical protein
VPPNTKNYDDGRLAGEDMFHASAIQNKICANVAWKKYGPIFLGCLILTSCAHIEIQPKDPQLEKIENFAEQFVRHVYDTDPTAYMKNQTALKTEAVPSVLTELQAKSLLAKTPAEAQAKLKTFSQPGELGGFRIENKDFSGKATPQGLVAVEVKGVTGNVAKPEKFDVIIYIGLKPKDQTPIVGAIQFK